MVVEHTFVTTMEAPEALNAASSVLQSFGFQAMPQSAFQMNGAWSAVEVQRGTARFRRGRGIRDWPQKIRVEWDRGKVEVAASIAPPARGRLDSNPSRLSGKEAVLVQQLLITISHTVELLLVHRLPAEQAQAAWAQLERELDEQAKRPDAAV